MKDEILKDKRILLWICLVVLSLIVIAIHPTTEGLASGLKYGLDLEGGSWLQLQLQGAMVELDVQPEKILQKQFNASSVDRRGDSYIIAINGVIPATLADDLGYSGAKSVQRDNVTRVTIITSPESVISNYLKKELDSDVKIVSITAVVYEIRTNVTRESLNELLAPVGG